MIIVNERKHSDSMNARKMNLMKYISSRIKRYYLFVFSFKIVETLTILAEKLNKYY